MKKHSIFCSMFFILVCSLPREGNAWVWLTSDCDSIFCDENPVTPWDPEHVSVKAHYGSLVGYDYLMQDEDHATFFTNTEAEHMIKSVIGYWDSIGASSTSRGPENLRAERLMVPSPHGPRARIMIS